MSHLALNLVLALIWTFLAGSFTLESVLVGFCAGFLALALLRPVIGSEVYVRGLWAVPRLLGVYAYQLCVASLQLARDILRRDPPIRGGFFQFDATAFSPAKTVLLSNLLSLTPGTITVDIDDDGNTLYIHTVYADDLERSRRGVELYADLIWSIAPGAPPPSDAETDPWRPSSS